MKFSRFSILLAILCCAHLPQISVGGDTDFDRILVSCCDWNGEFRLNLIPHPFSCLAFYHCESLLMPDGRYGTTPTLRRCPLDENGREQHYDFRTCKCLRENEALCFDPTISGHNNDFFNCTLPLIVEGINSRCHDETMEWLRKQ